MNNWKRILGTVIGAFVVIVFVCAATGCGGGGSSSPGDAPVTTPPEEVEDTLLGTDENGDGVRDDIEVYIAETYPDSEKIRMAVVGYAKVMQMELFDAEDKELSFQHAREADLTVACIKYVDPENGSKIWKELRAEILNTEERTRAYLKYDEQLGGGVFHFVPKTAEACSFDVDSLPN